MNTLSIEAIIKKLGSGQMLFCTYEQIIILTEKRLVGVLANFNYKTILVNNDFFHIYYPHCKDKAKAIQQDLEQDEDKNTQLYYDSLKLIDNIPFVSYLDANIQMDEEISISSRMDKSGLVLKKTSMGYSFWVCWGETF